MMNSQIDPHITSAAFINIKFNGRGVKTMLDSGAEATLISKNLAISLNLKINPPDKSLRFIAANKQTLTITGWTLLSFRIGQLEFSQEATVVENLSTNILLGTDWLNKNGVDISFQRKLVIIGKQSFQLLVHEKQTSHFISSVKHMEIKPFSNKIEWMDVPKDFTGEVLFEGVDTINNLEIRDGVFTVNHNKIPLILINKNKFPIVIEKRKLLGHIEQTASINQISVNKNEKKKHDTINQIEFDKNLTNSQKDEFDKIVKEYDDVFSKGDHDLGHFDKCKFEIITNSDRPVKCRPYRVPYAQQQTIDKMIDDMLTNKIITKSNSPWASPIVIVKKKDGSDRFCVDYRKLNQVTVKDNYPIPLIEETLDSLGGAHYFSTIDLASGYWQIALNDEAKEKTAFASHKGLFKFEVLPFGLSNAVPAFQRTMEIVLDGVPNCKVYLDDIIIYSRTFEEHLIHLIKVLQRLREANLKIKPQKCEFGKQEVRFLGFTINKQGIKPNEDKVEAIKNYPRPRNAKEVKRFLGMASYYRKFIKDYGSTAEPINRLLKKETKFYWSDECEESFKKLIFYLTNPPILIYPDFVKEFVLETDASTIGLGAVLAQKDKNGINRAIAYASRMLKPPERKYTATELEGLAIVWAVDQFKQYLYGQKFKIECDHNPLVYIQNMKNQKSRVCRWRDSLTQYDYEIVYKKGKLNVKADALSRAEVDKTQNEVDNPVKVISTIESGYITKESFREAQDSDQRLKELKENPPRNYSVEDGILYRRYEGKNLIVIPNSLIKAVLETCHNNLGGGHLGFKKTLAKVKERFY